MNHDSGSQPSHSQNDCPRRRLAQGALAAVDICSCGMLQVHIGALTLRMDPCALSELVSTLGQAVAAHSGRRFCVNGSQSHAALGGRNRGEA